MATHSADAGRRPYEGPYALEVRSVRPAGWTGGYYEFAGGGGTDGGIEGAN